MVTTTFPSITGSVILFRRSAELAVGADLSRPPPIYRPSVAFHIILFILLILILGLIHINPFHEKPTNVRRGEGGVERCGAPLWSPVGRSGAPVPQ
jgi:hypothetical protein